jgi:hypothetical protein
MKRIRTINAAVEEIRREDPATSITSYFIRKLVKSGAVRSIPDGSKRLVDFDDLLQYLEGVHDEKD